MTKENPQLQSKSQPELGWNLKKKKEMTGNLQPEASAMLISAFYSTLDSTWKKKRNLVLIITQSHRACPPPPPPLPPISFLFFSLPLALPNVLSRSFAPLLKYEHVGLIRGYGKKQNVYMNKNALDLNCTCLTGCNWVEHLARYSNMSTLASFVVTVKNKMCTWIRSLDLNCTFSEQRSPHPTPCPHTHTKSLQLFGIDVWQRSTISSEKVTKRSISLL